MNCQHTRRVRFHHRLVYFNSDGHGCRFTVDSRSLFAVGEHVFASHDSLSDPHDATRSLASGLRCDVTVTCLSAHGVLLCRSEAVVERLISARRSDRVRSTICCSLEEVSACIAEATREVSCANASECSLFASSLISLKLLPFTLTAKSGELSQEPACTKVVVSSNHAPVNFTSCRNAGVQLPSS